MNDSSLGYLCVFIAVICFGSNFIPLKRIIIGDGIFFQFIMCNAIFMTAIPVLIIQSFPPIHGLAFLGGFLWCTGNILCPTIIRFIGIGMGLILWGSCAMLLGWATGKFGLFGLKKQEIGNPTMNYIGMCLALIGLFVYVKVKTVDTSIDAKQYLISKSFNYDDTTESNRNSVTQPMLSNSSFKLNLPISTNNNNDNEIESYADENINTDDVIINNSRLDSSIYEDSTTISTVGFARSDSHLLYNQNRRYHLLKTMNNTLNNKEGITFGDHWSEETKRMIGIILAISSGMFFGACFDPSQYVIDNKYDGDDNSLNYVFSQYLGILLTSWFYTISYCYYCNYYEIKPYVQSEIIIPATISGIIWGIAETAYFIANGKLGFPVTFPIISAGPGFIGALWGVFIYKEIVGTENIRMLILAFCIMIPALILVALSH